MPIHFAKITSLFVFQTEKGSSISFSISQFDFLVLSARLIPFQHTRGRLHSTTHTPSSESTALSLTRISINCVCVCAHGTQIIARHCTARYTAKPSQRSDLVPSQLKQNVMIYTSSDTGTPRSLSSPDVDIDMTSTKEPTPAALDAEPRALNQLTSADERTASTATTITGSTTTQKAPIKKEQVNKFRAFNSDAAPSSVSHQHGAQVEAEINSAKDTKIDKET